MAYPHESKYKKEDNWGERRDCGDPEYGGDKAGQRPVEFCKPVTCLSTLTVNGATSLNQTSVAPPEITVGGVTYVPTIISFVSGMTPGADGGPGVPVYTQLQVLAAPVSG